MKFALVNDQRQEAQPRLLGSCIGCGSLMTAKCGDRRVWHWAHKGRRVCDQWWESETIWHRAWKDQFPIAWQEVRHSADDGTCHIADIKTPQGWVIELQHSRIQPDERRSREAFYGQLIWVVDATRLKRDIEQLAQSYDNGQPLTPGSWIRKASAANCRAFREWAGGPTPIFFDLGRGAPLMYLLPLPSSGIVYLHPVLREQFVEWHRSPASKAATDLSAMVSEIPQLVAALEARRSSVNVQMPHFHGRPRHRRL